jgi:hypothetical protein
MLQSMKKVALFAGQKSWTFHLNDRCQGSFIKATRNETMAARASHPCPCTRRRAIAQRQNQKWSQ